MKKIVTLLIISIFSIIAIPLFAQQQECVSLEGKIIKDTKSIIEAGEKLGWKISKIYATTLAGTAKFMINGKGNEGKGPIKFCLKEQKGKLQSKSGFEASFNKNKWTEVTNAKKK